MFSREPSVRTPLAPSSPLTSSHQLTLRLSPPPIFPARPPLALCSRYRPRHHVLVRRCLAERPCRDHRQRASPLAALPRLFGSTTRPTRTTRRALPVCVRLARAQRADEPSDAPLRAPQDQGNRTTPSYVAFTESERLIGDSAKCVPVSLCLLEDARALADSLCPPQEPGRDEPEADRLRRQAPHRPPFRRRRGQEGHGSLAVHGH